jgi:hypothetical protein
MGEVSQFEREGSRTSGAALTTARIVRYLIDITSRVSSVMTGKSVSNQISFRYRTHDSSTGVTRATAQKLATQLGVDETQAIHIALHDLAVRVLPQYEADDGPLSREQVRQIRRHAPKGAARVVRSTLFGKRPA